MKKQIKFIRKIVIKDGDDYLVSNIDGTGKIETFKNDFFISESADAKQPITRFYFSNDDGTILLSLLNKYINLASKIFYGKNNILYSFSIKQNQILDLNRLLPFSSEEFGENILGGYFKMVSYLAFFKKNQSMVKFDEWGITLAGTARKLLNSNQNLKYKRFWLRDLKIWKGINVGLFGGWMWLNPLFKGKEILTPLEDYDFVSLFPSIMLDYNLPHGGLIDYFDNNDFFIKQKNKARFWSVSVRYAETETIPFIPTKENNKEVYLREFKNKTFLFPEPLLKVFELYYKGDWDISLKYSYQTKKGDYDDYLNVLKVIKMNPNAQEEEKKLAKTLSNVVWGLDAQNPMEELQLIIPKEDFKEGFFLKEEKATIKDIKENFLKIENEKKINSYHKYKEFENFVVLEGFPKEKKLKSYIPLSAWITSIARAKMVIEINKNPNAINEVVQINTDGFVKIKSNFVHKNKDEYGKLKLKKVYESALFRETNQFFLKSFEPHENKIVSSGIKRAYDPTWKEWKRTNPTFFKMSCKIEIDKNGVHKKFYDVDYIDDEDFDREFWEEENNLYELLKDML